MRRAVFFLSLSVILLSIALIWSTSAYYGLENSLPYLLEGEEPYFNFHSIDSKGNVFGGEIFSDGVVVIFIYRDSDRVTDNWLIWSSVAEMVKKYGVRSYGLILNEGFGEFYQALENMERDEWFKIFAPIERNKFLMNFRLKYNSSQTIILQEGIVKMVKFGTLHDDDYDEIIKEIRKLVE